MTKTESAAAILPAITQASQGFWDAAQRGQLSLPHCRTCGEVWFPPSAACPQCLATDVDFKAVSGRAKLWSWIVMHRKYFSYFPPPYVVAFVVLEEGPMLMSTVVGSPPARLQCDMPLEAIFEPVAVDRSILKFRVATRK